VIFINGSQNSILTLSDVCELFLGKIVGSRIMTKYKDEISKFIKNKYNSLDYEYQNTTLNNIRIRGWLHLKIK